jgi:alkanesulfonate monooxygenase SsuD/methylene tetrahydromethanopterin reductase-like flavin-dependent oxidoreductase (luciferase family)
MNIGIGLPATIPGAAGSLILEWAKRADAGPFSSLAALDRLVYPNYEPLVTLAAAAGVTKRVRLITTILIAPLRNAGVLAKEAATLDAISDGRLSLGLAIGSREDDYTAAPAAFRNRGKRFVEQLSTMKRIWSGEPFSEGVGPVGPSPARTGGPEILIGGSKPAAIARVGRWADGYVAGGGGPERAAQSYRLAEESWRAAGRSGKPRFVAGAYYAIGADAKEAAGNYLRDYYRAMGPRAEAMVRALPTTAEEVKGVVGAFADIGVDEMILWPCVARIDQIDRLAEVVEADFR